jgi:UDP-3-O-[3-hydroxymyristoyl] glucosamine N-acyltransferase
MVRDTRLGKNVRIFEPVNIYEAEIGDDTKIGTFTEIQSGVIIGNRCKISSHSFLCSGVKIGDEVFVGHGVMFTNDKHPRSCNADGSMKTAEDYTMLTTNVESGVSIGVVPFSEAYADALDDEAEKMLLAEDEQMLRNEQA